LRENLPNLFAQSFIIRSVIAPPSLLLLNVLDLRNFSAMKLAAGMMVLMWLLLSMMMIIMTMMVMTKTTIQTCYYFYTISMKCRASEIRCRNSYTRSIGCIKAGSGQTVWPPESAM
jgi:hypothetical protein